MSNRYRAGSVTASPQDRDEAFETPLNREYKSTVILKKYWRIYGSCAPNSGRLPAHLIANCLPTWDLWQMTGTGSGVLTVPGAAAA
jgi:hypothetical protein